jgi:hypothetical protein
MSTIMPPSELLRRAVAHLDEILRECPEKPVAAAIDEVSMRWNLSPLDAAALYRIFSSGRFESREGSP